MSKHEFELKEFETRQRRVRETMDKEGLDLILVIAPQSIHWLIGTRAKSFQEFQCLFFTREPGPLTMLMRLAEVLEYTEQSLAEDIRGWGGREPEDPIDVVKTVMEEKGYCTQTVFDFSAKKKEDIMQKAETSAPSGEDLVIDEQNIPYEMDNGLGERARIGLIVLSGDQTIEYEIRQLLDLPGVALYGNRIYCAPTITPQTLKAMENKIPEATRLIMTGLPLDVIAYGCTSGSMQIGIKNVHARIHEVRPEVACTAPLQAAIAAFQALSASSIALITPYLDDINRCLRDYIQDGGFKVPVMGSWNEPEDENVGRITPDAIKEVVLKLGRSDLVDAVFISCTSVRALGIIKAAEKELGKPVLSSNLVLGWHCLRLAGVNDHLPQFGSLFEKTL